MSHQQLLSFPVDKRYFGYHHMLPLPAADANQTLCEANGLGYSGKDGWNDAQMIGEEDGLGLHEREPVTDG